VFAKDKSSLQTGLNQSQASKLSTSTLSLFDNYPRTPTDTISLIVEPNKLQILINTLEWSHSTQNQQSLIEFLDALERSYDGQSLQMRYYDAL
jgi:hypothetical protein